MSSSFTPTTKPGRAKFTRFRRYANIESDGIAAKLIVVGMLSNGFTIADPNDGGMMDVVGFDTATPQVMNDFVRGEM
jgi:60 kDa SS-A/Ro ribonucleoprotein